MRIYTRRGDAGQTDLIGGSRVGKDHPRVCGLGCVDELNATLGLAIAGCKQDVIKTPLITVQHRLFDIGAQIASHNDIPAHSKAPEAVKTILKTDIEAMERAMDDADARIQPLRFFILPGGCELAARLHLARTVCRRAEREAVELSRHTPVDPLAIAYLNRLSDLLFTLARLANHLADVEDVRWLAASETSSRAESGEPDASPPPV